MTSCFLPLYHAHFELTLAPQKSTMDATWGHCHRVLWKSEKKNKASPTSFWISVGLIYIWLNFYSTTFVLECHFYIILLEYLNLLTFIFFLSNQWISFCVLREPTMRSISVCLYLHTSACGHLHRRVFMHLYPIQGIVFNYENIDSGVTDAFNAQSWYLQTGWLWEGYFTS